MHKKEDLEKDNHALSQRSTKTEVAATPGSQEIAHPQP